MPQHRGETERNTVDAADALDAELAVRLGHRADEAHAARDAVELGRDESVARHDEVGTDDAGQLLLEAVLPSKLDDLLRLALIQILRDERRRGSARAAIVQVVERAVEGEEAGSQTLDGVDLFGGQCERLGADAPGDTLVFVLNPEETGGYRFVNVVRLLASREIRNRRRTRHGKERAPLSTAVGDLRTIEGDVAPPHTTPKARVAAIGLRPVAASVT